MKRAVHAPVFHVTEGALSVTSAVATRRRSVVACFLVVLGVAVFANLPAVAQQPDPPRREGGQGRPPRRPPNWEEEKEKARVRIGMTKEQQAQIEAIYTESEKKRQEAMRELGEKHQQLRAVYDSYEIDKTKERALLRDIVAVHWRLLRIHSEDEAKIRRILTKEQHEKLRALMKEAMEKARSRWNMGPRPPSPPGGGKN